jgi:hypothetical protein
MEAPCTPKPSMLGQPLCNPDTQTPACVSCLRSAMVTPSSKLPTCQPTLSLAPLAVEHRSTRLRAIGDLTLGRRAVTRRRRTHAGGSTDSIQASFLGGSDR